MPEDQTPDIPGETADQKYARLYGPQTTSAVAQPPAAPSIPPEFTSLLQEMQQEIRGLKEHVTKPAQVPVAPVDPDAWVEKIRQGDFKGARELLVEETKRGLQSEFQTVLQNANAQTQAQIEMDRHLAGVKAANPDLIEFAPYLEGPIQQRIEVARQAGKVRTTQDFIKEYKSAVDAEVAQLRNLSLKFRASGKDEATRRTTDVVSASTLSPQQVNSLTQPQDDGQEPPTETTEQYFARRRADEARRRGLG